MEGPIIQQGSPVENPLLEADNVMRTIRRFLYSPEEFKKETEAHIQEWIPILFKAARSARGDKVARYALMIDQLGEYVSEERYTSILELQMTNPAAIHKMIEDNFNPIQGMAEWVKERGQKLFKRKEAK